MPIYTYMARDLNGHLVRDTVAFQDEIALRSHLRKNNLFVLEVGVRRERRSIFAFRRGIGLRDLITTCRQLRTMINAGMPLVSGLEALAEQAPNNYLRDVLDEVSRSVGRGVKLATALEHHPHVFPPLVISLVRAGEEGGRLPETLQEVTR